MRILLIKTSSLGDIIHALPVLQDINKHYPLAIIDWMVEESFASILQTHKHINKIIPIAWRRWRKNLISITTLKEIKFFYKTLNENKYDHIIDMQGLIKSAIPSYLAKSSNTIIHGYANKSQQAGYEPLAKLAYTKKIPIPFKCHAVTRNRLLCAQALGYSINESEVKFDFSNHIHEFDNSIIFGHGTSRVDKEWGVNNWIKLGTKISLNYDVNIILPNGNAYEKHSSEMIKQGIINNNPNANIVILSRTTLQDLVSIIGKSSFFIGVDTGLSHIASALNISSIIIYNFDTTWRTHAFWNENIHSIYDHANIDLEKLWQLFTQKYIQQYELEKN